MKIMLILTHKIYCSFSQIMIVYSSFPLIRQFRWIWVGSVFVITQTHYSILDFIIRQWSAVTNVNTDNHNDLHKLWAMPAWITVMMYNTSSEVKLAGEYWQQELVPMYYTTVTANSVTICIKFESEFWQLTNILSAVSILRNPSH